MSNLPEVRRLLIEDFSDVEGDWIERLIYPINQFNEQVYNVLNKGVSVTDNILGTIVTATFTTPTDYVANQTFNPVSLLWKFKVQPSLVLMGRIYETDSTAIMKTAAVMTDWILASANQVQVRYITGLKNSTKYTATFLIL